MSINRTAGDLSKLFAANLWINFVFFLTFLALGLVLSDAEFGAFRVAQAYILIATTIAMLGLNTAVTHLLPRLSSSERKAALPPIVVLTMLSSLALGVMLYFMVPATNLETSNLKNFMYACSFPLIVAGATICNIALAVFQASDELAKFSKFQAVWKSLLFFAAIVGAIFLDSRSVLIAMALVYPLMFFISARYISPKEFFSKRKNFHKIDPRFFRSAIWPFASACVSIVYANIEFLNVDDTDLSSGLAGAYSLASLIFIGGAAFFVPFQTYAGSRIVNRKISIIGLLKLQVVCFISVTFVAGAAYIFSEFLNYMYPVKFNATFLDFSFLVCIKLTIWGSYAVTGSVLNFIDKGFESFILTVIVLSGVLASIIILGITDLREIVLVQIYSSIFLLVGCIYLFVTGYRDVHGI